MARRKTTTGKKKRSASGQPSRSRSEQGRPRGKKGKKATATRSTGRAIRRLDGRFREWRYEGEASGRDYGEVVAVSLAGVIAGVGTWLVGFTEEGHRFAQYGPYLLALSATVVIGYLMLGRGKLRPLRVGELGLGFEGGDGRVARTPWYRIQRIALAGGQLRVEGDGPIALPLQGYGAAVARVIAEALNRIPKRVDLDDTELNKIGQPDGNAGERLRVDPPQVTGESCLATNKALTFECDVRMCGRCGALYHCTGVPAKCSECGRKLKR